MFYHETLNEIPYDINLVFYRDTLNEIPYDINLVFYLETLNEIPYDINLVFYRETLNEIPYDINLVSYLETLCEILYLWFNLNWYIILSYLNMLTPVQETDMIMTYEWVSARKMKLHCWHTGVKSFLH